MVEEKELKTIIRMLEATTRTAEHLRMTGGEDRQSAAGVRQYNAVVKRLKDTDTIPEDMFAPLEEDASFIDLGMCCGQLGAYLGGMVEEPAREKKAEAPRIQGPVSIKIGDLRNLKDLGELMRQAMPSWLREQMEKHESKEGEEKAKKEGEPEGSMNALESRIAELGAQMRVLAERMHREELSSDEIRELADQMRQLGQQQSELAKQHAAIRAHKGTGEAAR